VLIIIIRFDVVDWQGQETSSRLHLNFLAGISFVYNCCMRAEYGVDDPPFLHFFIMIQEL
jgi:hypothetical protein